MQVVQMFFLPGSLVDTSVIKPVINLHIPAVPVSASHLEIGILSMKPDGVWLQTCMDQHARKGAKPPIGSPCKALGLPFFCTFLQTVTRILCGIQTHLLPRY